MRTRTLAAAVAGAFALTLTACSDSEPTETPPTATPTPPAEPTNDETESAEPTDDAGSTDTAESEEEETVSYAFDGDELNWTETWAFMDNMWAGMPPEDQDAFCGEYDNLGADETYRQLQELVTAESTDVVLAQDGVTDYLDDSCAWRLARASSTSATNDR